MTTSKKMEVRVPLSMGEYQMLKQACAREQMKYSDILRPIISQKLNEMDAEIASTGIITISTRYSNSCDEYMHIYIRLRPLDYNRMFKYSEFIGFSCPKMVRHLILPELYEFQNQ